MTRATHRGTCQICGRIQKLPEGVLAKHGYTVEWSCFNGTCPGSGHLPFEKSFALIPPIIESTKVRKLGLEEFKAKLMAYPAEGTTKAWVHVWRRAGRISMHVWMELEISFTRRDYGNGIFFTTEYEHPETHKPERLDCYGVHSARDTDYIHYLNMKRAADLDSEIQRLGEFIKWQQGRVDGWKEEPLLPLDGRHRHNAASSETRAQVVGRGQTTTETCACGATRLIHRAFGRNRFTHWETHKEQAV